MADTSTYVNLKVFLGTVAIIVSAFGYTNYQVGKSTELAYEAINRARTNETTIGRLEERLTGILNTVIEIKDIIKTQ